jgi:hypothetical protein
MKFPAVLLYSLTVELVFPPARLKTSFLNEASAP